MSREYVDRAFIDFDGTIIEADEFSYTGSKEKQIVAPMNRKNRATGRTEGTPSFELSMTVSLPEDGHDVDFDQAMLDGTEFTVGAEYPGGKARTFIYCTVDTIETSSSAGDGTKSSLTISSLDMFVD